MCALARSRSFDNDEINLDTVLASSCVPTLFQAVEIDGQHYWDGGYMGNPAIFPLIYGCDSPDVLIVHVNPIKREDLPMTAAEILNRINEISFNSSLMREMRAIGFITRLIDNGQCDNWQLKRMLIHGVAAEELAGLSVASKLNADWAFLTHLRDVGRRAAESWLDAHFDELGRQSTIEMEATFL